MGALSAAVVFLPLTGRQVDYWKDTETLYRLAVAIDPDRERAYATLARFYRQRRDCRREVIYLRKSLL